MFGVCGKVYIVFVCSLLFEMGSLVLSKSGRGVLLYPGDGSVWITSVKYLKMLLDGELKGNVLVLKELSGADDKGFGGFKHKSDRSGGVKPLGGVVLL